MSSSRRLALRTRLVLPARIARPVRQSAFGVALAGVLAATLASAAWAQATVALRVARVALELPELAVAHVGNAAAAPEAHLAEGGDLLHLPAGAGSGGFASADEPGAPGRRAERCCRDREELAALEPYLDIQRTRFSDWLQVGVHVPAELRRVLVPHLILQPLVENAIRHGVARRDGTMIWHDPLFAGEAGYTAVADVDLFKTLNDNYGHETGDRALQLFAKVLEDNVRGHDVVARYGGEEFVLVYPELTVKKAMEVIERIRLALEKAIEAAGLPPFTCSFGVTHSSSADTVDGIIRIADAGLLQAKDLGRNRVVFADLDLAAEVFGSGGASAVIDLTEAVDTDDVATDGAEAGLTG